MDKRRRDEMIFGLCYSQLARFKNLPLQSKEAASARLIIADQLFVLASAAAVRSGIRGDATCSLVKLMDDIQNQLKHDENDH